MKTSFPVDELEIVGYANVLPATMLPAVVPPIFRIRVDRNRVLVPPYSFRGGMLCNPTEVTMSEISSLAQGGAVNAFRSAPRRARQFQDANRFGFHAAL